MKPGEAQTRAASLIAEALERYNYAVEKYQKGYEDDANRAMKWASLQTDLATALLLVHGTLVTVPA